MGATVFFSWQADTKTLTGRNIIERALEKAVARISSDASIHDAVRDLAVDQGTQNVPGSPPVIETILGKIDDAAVVVSDLTFTGQRIDGRPTPNPNVLIEYGWALKSLTHSRIVSVMNTAYGKPTADTLPFDLGYLRHPIQFNCPEDVDEDTRRQVREKLSADLEAHIRLVLTSAEYLASLEPAVELPQFRPRGWEGSRGRFQSMGVAVGVSTSRLHNLAPVEVKLAPQPAVWLRVTPLIDEGRKWRVTELEELATRGHLELLPLGNNPVNLSYFRSEDAFGIYEHTGLDRETSTGVVAIFTTGEIWSVDTYYLDAFAGEGENHIPVLDQELSAALKRYATFLKKLDIDPPYWFEVGMEKLRERTLPSGFSNKFSGSGPCLKDILVGSGTYSPDDPPEKALRPFFADLFDLCGVPLPREV